MTRSGFSFAGRSLLFAILAGLAAIPVLMVGGPLVGHFWAWTVACLGAAIAYGVVVAPSWSKAVPAAVMATLIAALVASLAATPSEVAVGGALAVGICRSGLLYRRRGMRSLAVEIGLLTAGLLFARFLAGPSPLAAGLGLWGFFLVQSLFFVIAGWEMQERAGTRPDPFDEAEQQATEILRAADSV